MKIINKRKYKIYPKLENIINELDEEKKDIIIRRLNGETLKSIGDSIGKTRERIRQIEKKFFDSLEKIQIQENMYKSIFFEYDWTEETFLKIFKEKKTTFSYLQILEKKENRSLYEKKSLKEILNEKEIDLKTKKIIEENIYLDYVILKNGDKIKIEKNDILDYILKNYVKEGLRYEEVFVIYKNFLKEYSLEKNSKLLFTEKYFESKLETHPKILLQHGRKIRYYGDILVTENELIKVLDLKKYRDIEISTKKIFDENIYQMKKWDIQDEYELHNLIKKVIKDKEKLKLEISKMPTLKFGKSDREMQILNLLITLSPVSAKDFSIEYEKIYGVRNEVVIANYLLNFSKYYQDGLYIINQQSMDDSEYKIMKKNMTEKIYEINSIKKLYKNLFGKDDKGLINSYNLNKLGYRITYGYVLNKKYLSLENYFKKEILKKKIIDIKSMDVLGRKTSSYYSAIASLKRDFKIIAIEAYKYVLLEEIEKKGISIEMIKDYIDSVAQYKEDNSIFTVYSLNKEGFSHKLNEYNFDEWFYGSLLSTDPRFKTQKTKNNFIIEKKDKGNITLLKFIKAVMYKHFVADLEDIKRYLKLEYNIELEKHKILEKIKEDYQFYNNIKILINIEK